MGRPSIVITIIGCVSVVLALAVIGSANAARVESDVRATRGTSDARDAGLTRNAGDCTHCDGSSRPDISLSEWDRILRVYGGTGTALNATAPYNSMPAPRCLSCATTSGWGATCECTFQSTHGLVTGGAVHVRYKLDMSTHRIVDVHTEPAPPVRCDQMARRRAPPAALRTAFPFPPFNRENVPLTSTLDFVAAAAAAALRQQQQQQRPGERSSATDAERLLLDTLAQQQNARRLDVVASMGPVQVQRAGTGAMHALTLPACSAVPCTGTTGMLQVHASDVDICAAYVYNYRRPPTEGPRVTEEFLRSIAADPARPATRPCSVDAMTAPDSLGASNEHRMRTARAYDVCGQVLQASATARATIDGMDVITWIFTDACGLTTTIRHHVRIVDDAPPQVTLLVQPPSQRDLVLPCGLHDERTIATLRRLYPQADAQWTGVLDIKEPCGPAGAVRVHATPLLAADDPGIVHMTWTVTDAAGNNASVSLHHQLADQQRRVTTDTRICVWPPPVLNYAHVHLFALSNLREVAEALLTPSTCSKTSPPAAVGHLRAHVYSCEYDGADSRVAEAIRAGRLKERDMCYYDATTDLLYAWPIRDVDVVGYKVTIEFRDYKDRPGQPYVYGTGSDPTGDGSAAYHTIHVHVPSRITADTSTLCKDSASRGVLHLKTIPLDEMRVAAARQQHVVLKVGLPMARIQQYARQMGLSPASTD